MLLAEFDSYLVRDKFDFDLSLSYYRSGSIQGRNIIMALYRVDALGVKLKKTGEIRVEIKKDPIRGKNSFGSFSFDIPSDEDQASYRLELIVEGTDIKNEYTLWSYSYDKEAVKKLFDENEKIPFHVLTEEEQTDSVAMTYSTDFWCYPMFKSISESMGKDIPEGTMGLLIDTDHPAMKGFLTAAYTTPQWYDMIMRSRAKILDGTGIRPIVRVIDNFDRAHSLGLIYEDKGKIYSAIDLKELALGGCAPAYHLAKSLFSYLGGLS